jgi:hypothetical protein
MRSRLRLSIIQTGALETSVTVKQGRRPRLPILQTLAQSWIGRAVKERPIGQPAAAAGDGFDKLAFLKPAAKVLQQVDSLVLALSQSPTQHGREQGSTAIERLKVD